MKTNDKEKLTNAKVYNQYMMQIVARNASIKGVLTKVINESTLHKVQKQCLIQDLLDIETLSDWAKKLKDSYRGLRK